MKAPVIVSLLATAMVNAALSAQQTDPDRDDPGARARAYVAERANASGLIAADYWSRAWDSWNAMPVRTSLFGADIAWRPIGPSGLFNSQNSFTGIGQVAAGRVTSIAFHPTNGQSILLGTAGGGVWNSVSGGSFWAPISDFECSTVIGAVAVDPKDPSLVYAATGENNNSLPAFGGCGILRSSDAGRSWTRSTSNVSGTHGRILVDPNTAGSRTSTVLIAVGANGVFRSTNSGADWTRTLAVSGYASSVVAAPGRVGTFFTAVSNYGPGTPKTIVYKSTTSGASWTAIASVPWSANLDARVELATSAALPNAVFALATDQSTRLLVGLFRLDDDVQSPKWSVLPARNVVSNGAYPYHFGGQSEYNAVLAVDPRDANRIWIAGVGAFFSEDGGQSFKSTARSVHVDWHALEFDPADPDHMAAGTDGGIYISFDGGRSWSARNTNLSTAQFRPGLAVHPDGFGIFGGLQDNGSVVFSGSSVWDNVIKGNGDGGYTVVNYRDPSVVYSSHPFQNSIIRKSATGEVDITPSNLFISFDMTARSPRPLVINPLDPDKIYFATYRLFTSVNAGRFWRASSFDLTRTGPGYVTTLAVAPTDTAVLYAGTSDGNVAVSTNSGTNWTVKTLSPVRFVSRIVVDPTNAGHVLVTSSAAASVTRVEESTDFLKTITALGAPLPDVAVHTAVFIPGATSSTYTLMLGTDLGILQSSDAGRSWVKGPPGMPNVPVYDILYVAKSNSLVAGTYGRGVFSYGLGSTGVLRGDISGDRKVFSDDAALLQQALVGIDIKPFTPYPSGDANCDGKLDSSDVLLILRASVGLSTTGSCVNTNAIRAGG